MPDTDRYVPPTTWSEMFDHADPPIFAEEAQAPLPRSSATIHASRRRSNEQKAAQDRDLREIDAMVREEREDDALTDVIHRRRLGSKIPAGTMDLARAALQRRGSNLTTAEELAAQYMARS